MPGKRRYLLWQEMKLSWRIITIHEGKAVKPERMALATVCSHLCGWLMRAWVRVTAILLRLLCPPSVQKLSKPAWALKLLWEGRGYCSLPIKRCNLYKICSLMRKKVVNWTKQNVHAMHIKDYDSFWSTVKTIENPNSRVLLRHRLYIKG